MRRGRAAAEDASEAPETSDAAKSSGRRRPAERGDAAADRSLIAVAVLASFVAFLDGSVVNLALPAIAAEFGGGLALQQWVVDGYLLALGALILVAGAVSDQYGRLRVLRRGLVVFARRVAVCARSRPAAGCSSPHDACRVSARRFWCRVRWP